MTQGTFAKVKYAQHTETGEAYAIKVCRAHGKAIIRKLQCKAVTSFSSFFPSGKLPAWLRINPFSRQCKALNQSYS